MNRHIRKTSALRVAAMLLAGSMAWQIPGESHEAPYGRIAPIAQYLMADRNAEIGLARSAAPQSISRYASVIVLGLHGYETVSKGSNGFTCIVERAWMNPFESPEFWNPKLRGPICYNPPASRSILLYTLKRTELVLAGLSKAQMIDRINALFARKRLPQPEPGSMSYMMSKSGYLSDEAGGPWRPHLMFHVPRADGANNGVSWGADLPGSPVFLNTSYRHDPEPENIFMIPVGNWSDGTPARM